MDSVGVMVETDSMVVAYSIGKVGACLAIKGVLVEDIRKLVRRVILV